MNKKYSTAFERDYKFYISNFDVFSFWGGDDIFKPVYSPTGLSAKDFFYKLDSLGLEKVKSLTCKAPWRVSKVLKFKKGLNFHIKQWSEGYEDCMQSVHEYMAEFKNPPAWVEASFRKQLWKVYKNK